MSDKLARGILPLETLEGGDDQQAAATGAAPPAASSRPENIPARVWDILQEAGEEAATKLREMLQAPSFRNLKASEKLKLIDLALNRAYGPPVKREVSVQLSGQMEDAIAASLADLSSAAFPELRDITPETPASQPQRRAYAPRHRRTDKDG